MGADHLKMKARPPFFALTGREADIQGATFLQQFAEMGELFGIPVVKAGLDDRYCLGFGGI
jgi:hypothetical protein